MLNWYSCKSWVHWASALEVFTFYILKAPVRRTKKASVSVYGLDRNWIPTKAWAQVVGVGRRRTEDDARPTASGRCGRARRRRQVAARVWGSPSSLREAERYDCSCLIQTKYVTVFIKKRGK